MTFIYEQQTTWQIIYLGNCSYLSNIMKLSLPTCWYNPLELNKHICGINSIIIHWFVCQHKINVILLFLNLIYLWDIPYQYSVVIYVDSRDKMTNDFEHTSVQMLLAKITKFMMILNILFGIRLLPTYKPTYRWYLIDEIFRYQWIHYLSLLC